MRRAVPIARVLVLAAVAAAGPRAARAETPILLQVGVRVGHAFGGGWTFGPTLAAGATVVSAIGDGGGLLTLGLASSAFVTVGAGGPVTYGLTLGPEVVFVKNCPVVMVGAGGGGLLSFAGNRPASLGGQLAFGALVSSSPATRAYYDGADPRPFFTGATYRYLAPAPGVRRHELGAALSVPFFPGRGIGQGTGIGDCGGT